MSVLIAAASWFAWPALAGVLAVLGRACVIGLSSHSTAGGKR